MYVYTFSSHNSSTVPHPSHSPAISTFPRRAAGRPRQSAPSSSHRRALDRYEPERRNRTRALFPFVSSSSHRRRNAHTDTRNDARARPGAAQRSLGDRLRGGARAVPRGRRSRDRSIVEQCVTMRNIARSIASRERGRRRRARRRGRETVVGRMNRQSRRDEAWIWRLMSRER